MEYILGIAFIAVVAFLLFRKKDVSPTQLEVEIKAVEAKVVEEVKEPEVDKSKEVNENRNKLIDEDSLVGDSTKARKKLSWYPEYNFEDIISEMIHYELNNLN
jgi:GDP-D-mannose dehydratase